MPRRFADAKPNPMPDDADPRPEKPMPPEPGDCCGGGCVRCVFDIHEATLERYEAELAAWLARHPGERT